MPNSIKLIYSDGSENTFESPVCVQVNGETVFGCVSPPAPTIPFKVGDFVRVKRNINRCGNEAGPKARTAGKVVNIVNAGTCTVEFPGFIRGWGEGNHSRNYHLQRRGVEGPGVGYHPGKHEAISNIRLIHS